MRKLILLSLLALTQLHAQAQDLCANAIFLCASNKITGSTAGATVSPDDPSLNCGDMTLHNTVWYKVQGIAPGSVTVTVTKIDNNPGLSMRVFTGSCGSLTPFGPCTSGNGPNGSMAVTFPTSAGTTYYIMVDGENGNQEAFDIVATSAGPSILAKPDANFNTNPVNGCRPLTVQLENTSVINGGTGISYQWRLNGVPYTSSGADTTVVFNTVGTHSVELRVCNNECGCKSIVQDVIVQDLVPQIAYNPAVTCLGTPVTFNGSATIQPDQPFVNPIINSWNWNFGDPASGANNTSTLQNPTHTFVGSGPNFVVTLVVDGTCGPDTTTLNISLLPRPVLNAGNNQVLCEGATANISATVVSATMPLQSFQWTGPGTIACDTCLNTTVSGLAPGGPYTFTASLVDANGCVTSDVMRISINPTPVVSVSANQTICRNTPTVLNSTVLAGNGPFAYSWTPTSGLNNPNAANPFANISAPTTYCVSITDSIGCTSTPSCISLSFFPTPTIAASPAAACATAPAPIQSTFTVSSAGPGSTYSWITSANYPLITSSNGDSSSVTATFPQGVASTYSFQVIVTDGATGCKDTLSTSFVTNAPIQVTANGPFTICNGQSVTLQAANSASFNWTASPAYTFSDPANPTQVVNPTTTTVFTVTGTNGACTSTANVNVTVNPNPVAAVAAISPVCGCDTVVLSGTGSTSGMQYNWTSDNGSAIANANAMNTTAYVCATGNFTLTVTDPATGCFSSASNSVSQAPKPATQASVSPTLVCGVVNTIVNLDGTGSNTAPGTVYSWTSTPVVPIFNSSALVTSATVSGPTTFTLTVTAANGCDSTATAQVNVFPAPVISASPSSLCSSDPVKTVTISVNSAPAGATFSWTQIPLCVTPQVASGSSQVFDFTTCGLGSYDFTVQVNDVVNGCVYDLTTTVDLIAGVNLTVTPSQTICEGQPLTLTASGATSYLWGGGQTTASIVVSPGLTAAGSPYNFTVTGTTGTCSTSANTTVTVNPVPVTSAISGPAVACQLANGVGYSVTNLPGSTYAWTVSGGTIASGQGTSGITVNWTGSGAGSITVVQTLNGCDGTPQTLNVNLNPAPVTGAINGAVSVCAGAAGEIYSVNPVAGNTYTWAVSGGTLANGQGTSTIAVNWASAGSGTVTVFAVSNTGCPGDTVTINVTINPIPPAPTITGASSVCEGSTGLMYTVSGAPGPTFNWIINNGTITAGQGTNTITVDWPTAGSGSVGLTQTSTGNCTSPAANMSVTIAANPTATASVPPLPICQGGTVQITGGASNGTVNWTSSGTGTFSNPAISSPIYTASATDLGSITLTMTVSNPPCPAATANVSVTVNPTPVPPTISGAIDVCADSLGAVYDVTNNAGSTYNWTVNGGILMSGQGTSSIVIDWGSAGSGSISVIETNSFNCSSDPGLFNITIHPIPAAPVISGPANVCENGLGSIFTVPNNLGSVYNWNVSGGTIQSGQGSNSITVDWGTAGSGTVSVFETSLAGCESQATIFNVSIEALPPAPSPTGTLVVCEQSTGNIYTLTGTAGSTYTWTVTGGILTSGQGTDSIIVSWSGTGVGSIEVFETTAGGCEGPSAIINITIDPIPVTPNFTGPVLLCEGSLGQMYDVTPTAGSTYTWQVNGNGTLVSGQGGPSIVVDFPNPGNATIVLTETNSFGCPGAPVSISVQVSQTPTASVSAFPLTVCEGQSVLLNGTAPVGTITWTTSGNGTFSDPNIASPVYTTGSADVGTVTLTMTVDNAPCPSAMADVTINVNPTPAQPVVGGPSPVCQGNLGVLYTVNSTPGLTYQWSVVNGSIAAGQGTDSLFVDWISGGQGYVVVIATNSFNCSSSPDTLPVTVNPIPPTLVISGPISVCENDAAVVYSVTGLAGSTFNWTVSGGTIVSGAGTNAITVNWGAAGTGNVSVLETTNVGCDGIAQNVFVTINPIPVTAVPTGPLTVCAGATSIVYNTSGVAGSTFNWTISGGNIDSGQGTGSISVTWGVAGSGTVSVTEVSSAGCTGATVVINVNVSPIPAAPVITGPASVCEQSNGVIYNLNNVAGLVYTWNITGGSVVGSSNADSLVVNWGGAGSGVITVQAMSPDSCSSPVTTYNVNISGIPVALIQSAPASVCFGDSIQLTAGPSAGNYLWSSSGTGSFLNANTANATYLPGTDLGAITFTLTVDNAPCSNAVDMVTVIINPRPSVSVTANPTSLCQGDSTILTASGADTYIWNPGALVGSSVTVAPSLTTNYIVIAQNSFGCTSRDSVLVNVIPGPTVNAGADAIICGGVPVLLNGSSSNATGVTWSSSGNGTFNPNNTTANAIYQPGTLDIINGSVQLILTTNGGCRVVRDTITITIGDFATINAGPDQNLPPGSTVTLNPVITSPAVIWTSSGTGVFNPNASTPNAVYQPSALDFQNGGVTLILSAVGACNAVADSLNIKFNEFFVPNVITPLPHSPGYNDYFVILGLEENSALTIFNRWGIVVFESSNYQNDWGDGVNDDTYFYILKTKTEVYKGFVRVIKEK